jgi:hypothetical protein
MLRAGLSVFAADYQPNTGNACCATDYARQDDYVEPSTVHAQADCVIASQAGRCWEKNNGKRKNKDENAKENCG